MFLFFILILIILAYSSFNILTYKTLITEYLYTWNDTVQKQSVTEIASCLYNYINLKSMQGIKEIKIHANDLVLYKNGILISMLVKTSVELKLNVTIR